MSRPRVILIRENAETLTCSNCAGTLEGIDAFGSRKVPDYETIREIMDQTGRLYRALRHKFGEQIRIDVVDPRNAFYLFPTLISDYRTFHPPWSAFLKTVLWGASPASVIVNAQALHIGEFPAPEKLVEEVVRVLPSTQPVPS